MQYHAKKRPASICGIYPPPLCFLLSFLKDHPLDCHSCFDQNLALWSLVGLSDNLNLLLGYDAPTLNKKGKNTGLYTCFRLTKNIYRRLLKRKYFYIHSDIHTLGSDAFPLPLEMFDEQSTNCPIRTEIEAHTYGRTQTHDGFMLTYRTYIPFFVCIGITATVHFYMNKFILDISLFIIDRTFFMGCLIFKNKYNM